MKSIVKRTIFAGLLAASAANQIEAVKIWNAPKQVFQNIFAWIANGFSSQTFTQYREQAWHSVYCKAIKPIDGSHNANLYIGYEGSIFDKTFKKPAVFCDGCNKINCPKIASHVKCELHGGSGEGCLSCGFKQIKE